MQGHIIAAEKDLYRVHFEREEIPELLCSARGVFRNREESPVVGDRVVCRKTTPGQGVIEHILPRKNVLFRPPVANIDSILIVQTVHEPKLNPYNLDKLLLVMERTALPIYLCFNKIDRVHAQELRAWTQLYEQIGYPVFSVNALTGEGIAALYTALAGRITAIAGPSGAGKSTLIRYLSGDGRAESGSLSEKTKRGRQTTRRIHLFQIGENSYIFDTPGFSSLDLRDFSSGMEVAALFREFHGLSDCRFRNCTHRKEPGCRVREALENKTIAPSRYENYKLFFEEAERNRHA